MPALLDTRRERFAQALVRGEPPSAAYESAGYKPDRGNAHRAQRLDDVRQRVEELMAEEAQKHAAAISESVTALAIDKTWILSRLREVVDLGMAAGDLAPANRALELLGKATAPGMFAEHSVATVTNVNADIENMTDEESRAEFARLVAEAEAQGHVISLGGGKAGGLAQPTKRKALA